MECMTNSLLSIGTLIVAVVTAIATLAIVYLSYIQKNIAKKKRADDLFKVRWEVYEEIITKLKEHYNEPFNDEMSDQEYMKDEFLRYNGLNEVQYKEIVYNNLISKIRWLFNDEIAHMVKNLLINDPDENSKFVNITFYEDSIGTFCVTKEFTKNFDEYLKLDNQFMLKRFFSWKK